MAILMIIVNDYCNNDIWLLLTNIKYSNEM